MKFPRFLLHAAAGTGLGLMATAAAALADPDAARPDDNRFTPVALTAPGALDEPMVFEVLKDGRVFIAERKGAIKVFDPALPGVKIVGALAVNTRVRQGSGEQGLVGLTLDPKFDENGWIYLYYFHPTAERRVISRWLVRDNVLVANSEKVLIESEAQRETCCHTGGGMAWDPAGNLLITIGNNRGNNLQAQTDERPGRAPWDDQGGSANSNSLEGKILRIHPEPDGTYTIPPGNLFPPGTPRTRPEIYVMGVRNAWRVSVDSQTGFAYWGEVGPDGRQDTEIGPRGYDELNQARAAGFFGWPYFTGDQAFPHYDYAAEKPGAKQDPLKPVNRSPNNTGLTELPPLAAPFIYYPYNASDKFPEVGTGGRSATGGPVYRRADFKEPRRPWPAYFEGKWIATDLSRRWIMAISMTGNGDYKSMERLLPGYRPVEPIDMKFGPDGDLYVLEYGGRWFQASPEAKLTRIEFEAGNRKPIAFASADKTGGTPPFEVRLSAAGTKDYDGDPLTYRWEVVDAGGNARAFDAAEVTVRLQAVGAHVARLTVTDPSGARDTKSVRVVSGNEPPAVKLSVSGNETFFFPDQAFGYEVSVADPEDGSLADGRIAAGKVGLSIDYVSEGFDLSSIQGAPPGNEPGSRFPIAQALIARGNCRACHQVEGRLVGPSFTEVARKYAGDAEAPTRLAQKIVTGGAGVWGPVAMPPNALVTETDAAAILKYILSLADPSGGTLPLAGRYTPRLPEGDSGRGAIVLRATYTDQGEEAAPPLTGESVRVLRSPTLVPSQANVSERTETGQRGVLTKHGAVLGFRGLDLTGVKQLELSANALVNDAQPGGTIEIRIDSADGEMIGQARVEPRQFGFGGGRRGGRGGAAANPGNPGSGTESPTPPPSAATAPTGRGDAPAVAAGGSSPPSAGGPRGGPGGRGGRGGRGGFAIPGLKVDVKETRGRHDLFLVVRNDTAKPEAVLMTLSNIKLSHERTASAAPTQ